MEAIMARFEDSPALFGGGVGHSTDGEILCELCGKVYNKGIGDDGPGGDSIGTDYFGDLQICECCFERIENAVLQNMHRILLWFIKIQESKDKQSAKIKKLLWHIKENLAN